VLTVQAERRPEHDEGDEVLAAERPKGAYARRVLLGNTLDTDRIAAEYQNGVLEVTIPVSERAKPKKIEVAANGHQAQPVGAGAG
jgi:HSP20 family protein